MPSSAINITIRNAGRILPIGAGLMLLAACAAKYQPLANEPTAVIEFAKGYDKGFGLGAATNQFYTIARDRCVGFKTAAVLGMLDGPTKSRPVAAGQIYVDAQTVRYTGSAARYAGVNYGECKNRVMFTPEVGAQYRVVQRVVIGQNCRMEVSSIDRRFPDPVTTPVDVNSCPRK